MVFPQDIEASYRDMAADPAREKEAQEWSEGLIAGASFTEASKRSSEPLMNVDKAFCFHQRLSAARGFRCPAFTGIMICGG